MILAMASGQMKTGPENTDRKVTVWWGMGLLRSQNLAYPLWGPLGLRLWFLQCCGAIGLQGDCGTGERRTTLGQVTATRHFTKIQLFFLSKFSLS